MRLTLALLAALTLAACTPGSQFEPNEVDVRVSRAVNWSFLDNPFDTGAVTILAPEQGELRSYTIRDCGTATVCLGHRRAALVMAPDYAVIDGLVPGRVFYLSPGGDGWMKTGGTYVPIAWEDPNLATVLAPTRFTEDEILATTPPADPAS